LAATVVLNGISGCCAAATSTVSETALSERSMISVVDDDQSFRDSMRRLLKSLGYAVSVFPSAGEFLTSAELPATACLIADVHMPEMTGVGLYSHLIETGHTIPTILVTAYPDNDVEQRMLALGVVCYLRKPLEEANLICCLRTVFAHGKAQ
jgi:FixJ family two-component response regulator